MKHPTFVIIGLLICCSWLAPAIQALSSAAGDFNVGTNDQTNTNNVCSKGVVANDWRDAAVLLSSYTKAFDLYLSTSGTLDMQFKVSTYVEDTNVYSLKMADPAMNTTVVAGKGATRLSLSFLCSNAGKSNATVSITPFIGNMSNAFTTMDIRFTKVCAFPKLQAEVWPLLTLPAYGSVPAVINGKANTNWNHKDDKRDGSFNLGLWMSDDINGNSSLNAASEAASSSSSSSSAMAVTGASDFNKTTLNFTVSFVTIGGNGETLGAAVVTSNGPARDHYPTSDSDCSIVKMVYTCPAANVVSPAHPWLITMKINVGWETAISMVCVCVCVVGWGNVCVCMCYVCMCD